MVDFLIYLLLALPRIGAYAMLAIGIVVIFRASNVLNLAHGAMAMAPAYAVYSMSKFGIPVPIAVVLGVGVGALLGVVTERFFVRPLRRQGPTAQTVGTIAVFGLVVSLVAKFYGTTPLAGPRVFPAGGVDLQGSTLQWGNIGLFVTALVVAAGFLALFKFTSLGLALRGAADNRVAASLVGINPDRSAVVAWVMGGSLAALAGILLGGVTSLTPYSLALQMLPAFVAALIGGLGSLVGAVVGGFVVGALTGLVPAFGLISLTKRLATQLGMPELILTVVALIVMYLRGGRYTGSDIRAEQTTGTAPAATQRRFAGGAGEKHAGPLSPRALRYLILAALIVFPFANAPFTLVGDAVQACLFFIAASSIVLLTGWVGQISLAQAAFVGVGAYSSAIVVRSFELGFPFNLIAGAAVAAAFALALGVVALRVRGLYLAVATLIFAFMADAYLFVAPWFAGSGGASVANVEPVGTRGRMPYFDFADRRTFYYVALAVAAAVLFALSNLRDSKTGRAFFAVRGSEMAAASLGIDVARYKLLAFALAGGIAGLAGNLLLVSQGAVVAEQFAISRSLLYLAIAVVGGLQSLGGLIASSMIFALLNELFYRVEWLSGYLEVVSALLLAIVLLAYPGGLAAVPAGVRSVWERTAAPRRRVAERLHLAEAAESMRDGSRALGEIVAEWTARVPRPRRADGVRRTRLAEPRLGPLAVRPPAPTNGNGNGNGNGHTAAPHALVPAAAVPAALPAPAPEFVAGGDGATGDGTLLLAGTVPDDADEPVTNLGALDFATLGPDPGVPRGLVPAGTPVLEARDIRVQFGGLVAVDNASLKLFEGQIVGLIGPNGAGKTTLFNAISGLNQPTAGTVHMFGNDVTALPVHERARLGLGRTFQAIQLFPQLSVYENLLVATHANNASGLFSHVALTRRGLRYEAAAEEVVRRVIRFMGLAEVADRPVAGLPFGVLRQVEIARTLVTGAPVIMLDEPASGLDNAETDRLADLLFGLRDGLGVTLLLIEHDVRMVTQVSDYMYVLVYGKIVSRGRPDEVRNDPVVVAAYLGDAGSGSDDAPAPAAATTGVGA